MAGWPHNARHNPTLLRRSVATGMSALQEYAGTDFEPWLLPQAKAAYRTPLGAMLQGRSEEILPKIVRELKGKVQLIFTSPPFPLNNKKRYDNFQGDQYLLWFSSYASIFRSLLAPDGS